MYSRWSLRWITDDGEFELETKKKIKLYILHVRLSLQISYRVLHIVHRQKKRERTFFSFFWSKTIYKFIQNCTLSSGRFNKFLTHIFAAHVVAVASAFDNYLCVTPIFLKCISLLETKMYKFYCLQSELFGTKLWKYLYSIVVN